MQKRTKLIVSLSFNTIIVFEKCIVSDVKTVISIGNRFNNKRPRRGPIHSARRFRTIFYYNQEGKFRSKRIGLIKSLYYRCVKVVERVVVCSSCKRKFKIQARKSALKSYMCTNCSIDQ